MSPRVPVPESHSGRVERALYNRCRRGEAEALTTLLYRMVDRLYTAASFVAPDEASATTAVVLAWEDTLALLARPHVGGHLRRRAFGQLGRRLADYGDRRAVGRALHSAAQEDEAALLPLPEALLGPLVELTHRYAADIAMAHAERRALRGRVLQSAAAAGLLVIAYYAWMGVEARRGGPEIQLTCLQQRITRDELIENLRDCTTELPDPQGADQLRAKALQRVSLALEEIVNSRSRLALRYVAQRIQREGLSQELSEIIPDYEGAARQSLLRTQLALDEVQGL